MKGRKKIEELCRTLRNGAEHIDTIAERLIIESCERVQLADSLEAVASGLTDEQLDKLTADLVLDLPN